MLPSFSGWLWRWGPTVFTHVCMFFRARTKFVRNSATYEPCTHWKAVIPKLSQCCFHPADRTVFTPHCRWPRPLTVSLPSSHGWQSAQNRSPLVWPDDLIRWKPPSGPNLTEQTTLTQNQSTVSSRGNPAAVDFYMTMWDCSGCLVIQIICYNDLAVFETEPTAGWMDEWMNGETCEA